MENKYECIEKVISKANIKYNEPMKNHTTMKVGGNCSCFVEPESIDELKAVIKCANENNIEYFVIGNGSNLLVSDSGIDILVIKPKFQKIEVEGEYIKVEAGYPVPKLSATARDNSLSGLEFACGIPGSIGGGIRMNAGAYGSEMKDTVQKIGYLDENANLIEIDNSEAMFSYRYSMFIANPKYIIVYAIFKLKKGNKEEISKVMQENMLSRKTKQPLEYPNFGSVFKRPEGYFVGKLVDECGLKGYTIGGAQVSTKHSGFIVNIGGATCSDVLELIEHIKSQVYAKFKVKLQEEVVYLGGK